MNRLYYKGFSVGVDYDDEEAVLVGRVVGIQDVVGVHAKSVPELEAAFHEAEDDFVATCAMVGKNPQKACSGRVMFHKSSDLHRAAAAAAEPSGFSLDKRVEVVIREAVGWPV